MYLHLYVDILLYVVVDVLLLLMLMLLLIFCGLVVSQMAWLPSSAWMCVGS